MPRPAVHRRRFLRQAGSALVSAVAFPTFVPRSALGGSKMPGANQRVQIGVIGVGIRGKYLIGSLPPGGRVVAISDWYQPRMVEALRPTSRTKWAQMLTDFAERDARKCAMYADYRRLLDNADLDAVMIATPDHHHVQAAVLACQAGLDVYVEKAMSKTVVEGRRLVQAVRRYQRVCQVGSQNRSMATNRYGCRLIREGGIGKVSLVELPNYPGPLVYGGLPAEQIPTGCDWNLFCGPTPARPYHWRLWRKDERKFEGKNWRGWDMWRAYSGHLMTNWGAHSVDMVQLALGTDGTGPVEIWPMLEDHPGERRTCPVAARYADGVELHFTGKLADQWAFHGERGKAFMRRNRFSTDPLELMVDPPDVEEQQRIWQGTSLVARPHIQNWLDCIKTRSDPVAPVEVGHSTATICHLAAIARELGRRLRWDPVREVFPDDAQANAMLDRPRCPGWDLPTIV